MKKIELSNGSEGTIRIHHTQIELDGQPRRATRISFNVGNRRFISTAVCNPCDNFCRKTGRKMAASRLLKRCRDRSESFLSALTRRDRRRIFQAVCPEFKQERED